MQLTHLSHHQEQHCVKIIQIWSFSGPYLPAFGLNIKNYSVNLCIQSKYWKIQTRENSVFGHFSRRAIKSFLVKSSRVSHRCLYNFWTIGFWRKCSPRCFPKIFKTVFSQSITGCLLLMSDFLLHRY